MLVESPVTVTADAAAPPPSVVVPDVVPEAVPDVVPLGSASTLAVPPAITDEVDVW